MSWAETAAKRENITVKRRTDGHITATRKLCCMDAGKFEDEIVDVPVEKGKAGTSYFSIQMRDRAAKRPWKACRAPARYPAGCVLPVILFGE